jgi:hypothetical protein
MGRREHREKKGKVEEMGRRKKTSSARVGSASSNLCMGLQQ